MDQHLLEGAGEERVIFSGQKENKNEMLEALLTQLVILGLYMIQ